MIKQCIGNTVSVMKDSVSLGIFSIYQYSRVTEKSKHPFFRLLIVLSHLSLENIQTKPYAQMDIAIYQEAK